MRTPISTSAFCSIRFPCLSFGPAIVQIQWRQIEAIHLDTKRKFMVDSRAVERYWKRCSVGRIGNQPVELKLERLTMTRARSITAVAITLLVSPAQVALGQ